VTGVQTCALPISRNHCRNHLRSRGALRRHVEAAAVDETSSPEQIDALLVQERRRSVRNALGRLPEPMREALVLRYGEELRYDQMAEVVRAGESTLRSRVHHGLRLLRSLLEKDR